MDAEIKQEIIRVENLMNENFSKLFDKFDSLKESLSTFSQELAVLKDRQTRDHEMIMTLEKRGEQLRIMQSNSFFSGVTKVASLIGLVTGIGALATVILKGVI